MPAELEIRFIGLGSNLLVRDGGFPGTVISTFNVLSGIDWLEDTVLRAGAGATCSKVARTAAKAGMVGAEFLAGIPGTLGGALAMNAGAFGGETWDRVESVETMARIITETEASASFDVSTVGTFTEIWPGSETLTSDGSLDVIVPALSARVFAAECELYPEVLARLAAELD